MSNSVSPWLTNLTTSNFLKPTYVNGFLDVSGGDILNRAGNLYLLGGDANLNKRLLVTGDVSMNGNVYIAKDITIHGNLTVDQYKTNAVISTIATNVFSLNEDISLNGNLSVSGNVNFPNNSIPNSAIIGGGFGGAFFTNTQAKFIAAGSKVSMNLDNITADTLDLVGTLSVSKAFGVGVTNPQYPIDVGTGGVGCGRYVQFGDVPLSATTAPTPVVTNIILGTFNELLTTIAADTSLNGRLFVSADSSLNGRLYVGGDASLGGRLFVGSKLSVGGDASLNSRLFVGSNLSVGGAAVFKGDVSINGNVDFQGGVFRVGADSQNSLLATTGAFQIIDQSNSGFSFTEYNNTDGAVLRCRRALGTTASPLPVTTGTNLTAYRGFGYNGIGFQRAAGIEIRAAEDFSITKNGTSLAFQVTNTGTTSYYDAMTILNGNVGIGTVVPQYTLDVSSVASAPLRIGVGSTNALIVNSNGNILVGGDVSLNGRLYVMSDTSLNGNMSLGGNLVVNGNLSVNNYRTASVTNTITTNVFNVVEDLSLNGRFFTSGDVSLGGRLFVQMDGAFNRNVTMSGNASALSFQTTSDYRIKENVRGLSGNITVDSLKPIQYFNTRARRLDIGFLAHEVQEDFPFLVEGEKDGENLQTLNYIGLVGVLVKEIQELKARVTMLESQVSHTIPPLNP